MRALQINIAEENKPDYGFNIVTDIESDMDLMDKIRSAVKAQPTHRTKAEIKLMILAFATTYKENNPGNAKRLEQIANELR